MIYKKWMSVLTAAITSLILVITSQATAQEKPIDLAKIPDNSELTGAMLAISENWDIKTLSVAQDFTDWVRPNEDTLDAPRQHATTWLKAAVHNSSDQALTRWLVLEPWRMSRVDAFFLDPETRDILWQKTTGLAAKLEDRAVSNGKTVIPVQLNAGETQQLFLRIESDSLPFVSVRSWDPATYSQSINANRTFQIALLAAIVTLLVMLALQFNAGLFITGTWLLVAFIFETEKDGFFSLYLLRFLEDYSINLRVSAWVFTEQLFLTTSVFLLGLSGSRFWRNFLIMTGISATVIAGLTFILDGNSIRKAGILVTGLYSISWLFMIKPALQAKRTGQITILALLFGYWALSSFLLLGYTFNFYYTSAFAVARIYIEILIALALILIYSWQQKLQIKIAEAALKEQERGSRKALELAVENRTEELNNALDSARKANTAKVNFLGQITHDLRSPLTAILGYAQLQGTGAVNAQSANQVIQDRALYMKDLVDGLVDYAQDITADDGKIHDVYLVAFIDNLVSHAHVIANTQNNRFQIKIETDLPMIIRCNSTQLQRILLNLLDNAAKYTSHGEISLSVALSYSQDQQQSLTFRVSDTGSGIAPGQLEHIFTPFYQGSEENSGAGLGLATSLELVEHMGGTLHLESDPGKGTIATCTFPYTPGDEQRVTPSLPVIQDFLPVLNAQGQKAWIIEDSRQIAELLDQELTDMGFEVELAVTAEDFIEATSCMLITPSVIITDYRLPGASGTQVLHAARTKWPGVPVILLSATQSGNASSWDELSERFNAYLSKPVNRLELRLKLAELCNLPVNES